MKIENYTTEGIQDGDLALGYRPSSGQTILLSGIQSQGTSSPQITAVEFDSADILDFDAAKFPLSSPSDTDQYYDIDKIVFEFTPGNVNYTLGVPIRIRGAFVADVDQTLITQGTNQTVVLRAQTAPIAPVGTGAALSISTASAPTLGTGTLKMIIFYTIRTFGE
jgi:hypothetical protein